MTEARGECWGFLSLEVGALLRSLHTITERPQTTTNDNMEDYTREPQPKSSSDKLVLCSFNYTEWLSVI